MVNRSPSILLPAGKDETKCKYRKYQNFVFDCVIDVGWLFFNIFDYPTQFTVARKYLYLAFVSSLMADHYFLLFSCCIHTRGVF